MTVDSERRGPSLATRMSDVGLRMRVRFIRRGPRRGWHREQEVDQWLCTLSLDGRQIGVEYSLGMAHGQRQPRKAEVVGCVLDDIRGLDDCQGFEDWAATYGYDPDSRAAEATFRAVEAQRGRVAYLLGPHFETFLDADLTRTEG